jgi:hypothetical protein
MILLLSPFPGETFPGTCGARIRWFDDANAVSRIEVFIAAQRQVVLGALFP